MQDQSVQNRKRNRKRSRRRAIFCPVHQVYMESVSQKFSLYADKAEQLRSRGMGRKTAMFLVANAKTVPLTGEWIEEFWCDHCQQRQWFHVRKVEQQYFVRHAPRELWEQASGVIHPSGNPSVGQFTRRHSRAQGRTQLRDFGFVMGQ